MFIFPAYLTPTASAVLLTLSFPAAGLVLLIWFVLKVRRIEKTLQQILEQLKENRQS